MAQCEIKGLKLKDHKCQVVPNKLLQLKEVTMPLKAIFPDTKTVGGRDLDDAKAAFRSLSKKGIEYETKDFWQYTEIISKPKIYKHAGEWYTQFNVYDEIWYCLLDFSKGYRKFEMMTAMSFNSVFSMQLYELVSGQDRPYDLMKDTVIKMFKLSKVMSSAQHIEGKVLDMAKKDLDAKAPYSFTYERIEVKSRGRGGKKTIGWRLFPYFIHKNRNHALEMKDIAAQLPAGGRFGGCLDPNVYDTLLNEFHWEKSSINANKQTLLKAQETIPNFKGNLRTLCKRSQNKAKSIGWVIGTLKNMIEEYENDNKEKEAHEAAPAAPVAPSAPTQPATPPTGSEAGKRRLQNAASMLANKYNVREPDLFSQKR